MPAFISTTTVGDFTTGNVGLASLEYSQDGKVRYVRHAGEGLSVRGGVKASSFRLADNTGSVFRAAPEPGQPGGGFAPVNPDPVAVRKAPALGGGGASLPTVLIFGGAALGFLYYLRRTGAL